MEFPVHPIQETGKRLDGGADQNLAVLVEVLHLLVPSTVSC
jgi:hypothetical protein